MRIRLSNGQVWNISPAKDASRGVFVEIIQGQRKMPLQFFPGYKQPVYLVADLSAVWRSLGFTWFELVPHLDEMLKWVEVAMAAYGIKANLTVEAVTNGIYVSFASIHLCTKYLPGEFSEEVFGYEVLFWTVDSGTPDSPGGDEVGEWKHFDRLEPALNHMFSRMLEMQLEDRLAGAYEQLAWQIMEAEQVSAS